VLASLAAPFESGYWAGDFADLQSLAALKQEYRFLLAIDEAHATFVCGHR